MKYRILLLSFLYSFFFTLSLYPQTVLSNKMIWEGDNYASFTSLRYYDGVFYCSFRNANKHADTEGNDCGIIKIIKSKDGEVWEYLLTFSEKGFDLRDPQLSITKDNKLMLITNKVKYQQGKAVYRQTCYAYIDNDNDQKPLTPLVFEPVLDGNWLWNVEWIDGNACGFIYSPYFAFTKSQDGIHYRITERILLDDSPSEASMMKFGRRIVTVVRRNTNSLIGIFDKNKWEWFDSGQKVACPKLIKIKKNLYVVGRYYGEKKQTALFKVDMKRHVLKFVLGIPCKTDCGYPGVVYKDKLLYISYYSGDGKKSNIYMAKIKL